MNIPNIPTDNLYKFLSLSGVLLFIVAMVIPEIRRQAINDDIVNINGDIEMFEFEIKLVEDERNNLKRRLKYLDEKCNCGIVSEISDSLIVHYTITSGSKELIALSKEADSLIILYRENSEKLVKCQLT